jgi:hypothetical protein
MSKMCVIKFTELYIYRLKRENGNLYFLFHFSSSLVMAQKVKYFTIYSDIKFPVPLPITALHGKMVGFCIVENL